MSPLRNLIAASAALLVWAPGSAVAQTAGSSAEPTGTRSSAEPTATGSSVAQTAGSSAEPTATGSSVGPTGTGSSAEPNATAGPAALDRPTAGARDGERRDERAAVHVQATFVVQGNLPFRSSYSGANSLHAEGETRETADVTLYAGISPWKGAELWINPELDQGFGLANTLGAAGYPSAEAYKVGKAIPYLRLQRLFLRQSIALSGKVEALEADQNQLGGHRRADRIVVTIGKIGVGDIFDTNVYAHDPRADFLNWAVVDAASFDYAADAWGYSYGGAAELDRGRLTLRAGLFDLSKVPNSERLETGFSQYEIAGEFEERHRLGGSAGKVKLTGFLNHGWMGRFDAAVAAATAAGRPTDVAAVRRFATRAGVSVNVEQAINDDVGIFVRAGVADDRYESFEFTDADQTLSGGVSIKGSGWHRRDDQFGLAVAIDRAGGPRRRYLDAGGLGILVGDGRLPHPGDEHIAEASYDLAVAKALHVSVDAQLIDHPAYNRDRGPVAVFAGRIHIQR